MPQYFLGVDVGGTKTHVMIADETGRPAGLSTAGPGNPEEVGWDGLAAVLQNGVDQALGAAGLAREQIRGAGFGVAGYDWPSEREPTLQAIATLGLNAPVDAVNDSTLGLLAGSVDGFGVAVVSGTGCNCRGWDRGRRHEGRVTGHGLMAGEGAGGSELMHRVLVTLAHEWTRRGPPTLLTPVLLAHTGAPTLADLLEGVFTEKIQLDASAAPLVFRVAAEGDTVALGLIRWAGQELGEMANAVVRQLDMAALEFDVVLIGSMFDGGPMLIEPMRETVHSLAPGARLVRLSAPPVTGAVVLGMEAAGIWPTAAMRDALGLGAGVARI